MRDLLVITPSRGRPERLREMITACLDLATTRTGISVAIDYDDPEREAYEAFLRPLQKEAEVCVYTGSRATLTTWTNRLAREHCADWPGRDPLLPGPMHPPYRALASLGDDHIPSTPGWDSLLLAAIDDMGGTGIAYGNDLVFSQGLPTAPVISSDIVAALGWMCEPSLDHMAVDLVWKDLGLGAGCLAYVPEVIIEHVHPCIGKAAWDQTYAASEAGKEADVARYETWRAERMAADVRTIRDLIERKTV